MDLGWRWDDLSCQDLNSCCKVDSTSRNMMLSIFYCVRLFDSFIWSSEEIGIDTIYGTLIDLRRSLLTNILFNVKNLMKHLMISVSYVFTSTNYAISLCTSSVYLRESPIWKGEFVALDWVESLQNLFDGLTRGLYIYFLILPP